MKSVNFPLAVLFGYESGTDKMIFVGRKNDIVFHLEEHRAELVRMLSLCNGHNSVKDIRRKFPRLSDVEFTELMEMVIEHGIVRDSRHLYLSLHEDSANPMRFTQSLSPEAAEDLVNNRPEIPSTPTSIQLPEPSTDRSALLNLCANRKSNREFNGHGLTTIEISGLLKSMYTVGTRRSTPSAGHLYPLDIYVAVLADNSEGIAPGLYRYDPRNFTLNPRPEIEITSDIIGHALNSHQADNAAVVIFIAADLERSAAKYANRGYRFALMEAGHAAQNAHLFCAENPELGMVEYGGFEDETCAQIVGLDYPHQAVLLAIVLGRISPNARETTSFVSTSWELTEQLVGKGKPIEYLSIGQPNDGPYKPPRFEASAKYRGHSRDTIDQIPEKDRFGSGHAITSDESLVKAIAESYERYASGLLRIDATAKARDLPIQWLDPRQVVPLHPSAYKRNQFIPFSPAETCQWVQAYRHNHNYPVMVPVEMAFYPLSFEQLGRTPCFACSSNGVAAHPHKETASAKALLELVERDAIAVTWYAKRQVNSLPTEFLPPDVRIRMRHWNQKGWKTKVLNLTLDSVPVALAIIYSNRRYPSFVAGASAGFEWNTAITKAWDEAEMFLMGWKAKKRTKPIAPQDVFSVLDHGTMYFRSQSLPHVEWLINSTEAEPKPSSMNNSAQLLWHFDPVLVDLNPANPEISLRVIRAISEKLLPINFGYGTEHIGHRRFGDLGMEWKRDFPSIPHFFA